jgi:dipeptidyl aminopeptidase/acylaminoacyl peptidase
MIRRIYVAVMVVLMSVALLAQSPRAGAPTPPSQAELAARRQAYVDAQDKERREITEPFWRKVSAGVMHMERITMKSRADGMEIPTWVFSPLTPRGPKAHAALVWVHPDIRGYMYEYYAPYVIEAIRRGYAVIAPEYRGSVGYGTAHYDAIDYGGAEVDDVLTSLDYLKGMPIVDIDRVGIIGWSHGGMITLLSAERSPKSFKAVAALVPVTNLFQRLSWNGDSYRRAIDPQNRTGGTPAEQKDVYKERSAIYGLDKIEAPVLVHITRNDGDVVIEEAMQLVDALRARRPLTSETRIYDAPKGGHLFDRQAPANDDQRPGVAPPDPMDPATYAPENTPEQRDSWNRVWTFLEWHLQPYR